MNIGYKDKYLKYKNKYLQLNNMNGGEIRIIREKFIRIGENISQFSRAYCFNTFTANEKKLNELFVIGGVLGTGVNGEVLSVNLRNAENDIIAVKTIPVSQSDYTSIDTKCNDGVNKVSSTKAEIEALKIVTRYVLDNKSPHFNIMYGYFLCDSCKYHGPDILNRVFDDTIDSEYRTRINSIREKNARAEGNHIERKYRIKDVQELNNEQLSIKQHCIYILSEIADGDMSKLITADLSFDNLKIYLFQIFSALNLCLIEDEMSHHDLHIKNILYINDNHEDFDHDIYNFVVIKNDREEVKVCVKLPLNGKILKLWDFGRVNIQRKIHITGSTYFREDRKIRFFRDIEKLITSSPIGLNNIISNVDFKVFLSAIITNYQENGYYGLMMFLIENINEINSECSKPRFTYGINTQ